VRSKSLGSSELPSDEKLSMMTNREILKLIEGYIGVDAGYLNGFSYSKHDDFYARYCDMDVDVHAYRAKGMTTRRAFEAILRASKPREQAKIIRGAFEMLPPPDEPTSDERERKQIDVYKQLVQVAARLESDGLVETPKLEATSEVVFEALKDAEILLEKRGPKNAVDRAHTALHGYLKKICSDRGAAVPDDPSLTTLFKTIRETFPEFSGTIPHDAEARRVIGSIASALDSLNTIRNRGTLAHPNELLLETSEAMLYTNLSRAVLAYVNSKLKP
jgi:hypothetical protein